MERKLFVTRDPIRDEGYHDLFMGRSKTEGIALPIFYCIEEFGREKVIPTTCLLPELGRMEKRERDLLSPYRI
jgi:hypothetical protein